MHESLKRAQSILELVALEGLTFHGVDPRNDLFEALREVVQTALMDLLDSLALIHHLVLILLRQSLDGIVRILKHRVNLGGNFSQLCLLLLGNTQIY